MRYLVCLFLLSGCASIDREAIERIAKNRGVTLMESGQDKLVLKRNKECHCAMLQFERKF